MSIPKMALLAAAAVAVFSLTTTGFSDGTNPVGAVVTAEEREAYEAARFMTPEGKAVAEEGLVRITAKTDQATSGADVLNDALLRPRDWPALAQGKLCEYTATLMNNAERDGTAVPEKAQSAADRILKHC